MLSLIRHPDSPSSAVNTVEVEVTPRPHNGLELRYRVTGRIGEIAFPALARGRADDLWKHTCFELFIRPAGGDGYHEFNFSPSMQWAAYGFDGYRSGMRSADELGTLDFRLGGHAGLYDLQVALDLEGVIPADADWRLALAAVIEEKSGQLSYWALAHAEGKPDFHHPDAFALALPATDRP